MSGVKTSETLLGDFRTDTRMLVLAGLAIPIGIISIDRLPVVERSNQKKLVGYLGRASIMHARQRYHAEEEERARGFIQSDALAGESATRLAARSS